MKTILSSLTILAALGGHAMAASEANTDARALNARWVEQGFSALPPEVLWNQLTVIRNDDPASAPVKLNQSATSQPLRLADQTHAHGFGLNATYDLPATGEGVAFVFRRSESPYYGYQLNPRGIDPAADYEVTEARSYTPDKARRMKGAELQRYRASIEEAPGSLLLEYRKVQPTEK
jgi:hypothetical protein